MYCKVCGNKIDDDSTYCTFCGAKQMQGSDNLKNITSRRDIERRKSVYDLAYKKQTSLTYFGVALFLLPCVLYFFKSGDNISEEVQKENFIIFSIVALVIRIVVARVLYETAKEQNRNSLSWGLLGFFFPSIALIIIGQLNKLNKV